MKIKNKYKITEIIELYHLKKIFIYECIEREWIIPSDSKDQLLDHEDITRILLIKDLKEVFEVNDESIPIILHLIDELHSIKSHLSDYINKTEK